MFELTPSEDQRVFAGTTWQLFLALRQEGFSPDQALELVKATISASS